MMEPANPLESVPVDIPGKSYEILIGPGALSLAAAPLASVVRGRACGIVTDATVARLWEAPTREALQKAGAPAVATIAFPPGEEAKTPATLARVWRGLAKAGLDRSSVVVALGGGVPGDIAGFAAATFMRGVACVQVPTTLLAMVDSSVGGKTAVDLPEGKNLVGAFWQPSLVLADVSALATLPQRETRSGLAEVVKYGVISDPWLLDVAESAPEALLAPDLDLIRSVVARSCRIKARIVAMDERESGPRAVLNFGHTFGHAIETLTGFSRYTHGEAVGVGMLMASRLAASLGFADGSLEKRLRSILGRLGLPTAAPSLDPNAALEAMRGDKKSLRGRLRLVLPRRAGDAFLACDIPDSAVVEAFAAYA